MSEPDNVPRYAIRYRADGTHTDEEAADQYAAQREHVEVMYDEMTDEVQLDLLLMLTNMAEMRLGMTSPETPSFQWLMVYSLMLRHLLSIMTHLHPQAPKPSIALEDPGLYWPNAGETIN